MRGGLLQTLKQLKMPHTLVVVEALVLLVLVLSWLIPSGEFTRVAVNGRMVPDPATFHVLLPKVYLSPTLLVLAPIRGFLDGGLLIVFCW